MLSCFYSNVDSLFNKRNELLARIATAPPDIIALTEIYPKCFNLANCSESELYIDNYDMFLGKTCKNTKRGVALYVKSSLNAQPVDNLSDDIYRESVWCELNLKNSDKLLIGCIYRSPDKSTDLNNQALLDLVTKASNLDKSHLVVVGDFNMRSIDWTTWTVGESENHIASKFLESLRDCYLTQHVTMPTRYRADQQPSVLDLIISNDENIISDIEYAPPLGKSDHVVMNFNVLCHAERSQPSCSKFIFDKGDYTTMSTSLSDLDWGEILHSTDIDNMWTAFMERMLCVMNTHIPTSRPGTAGRKVKAPWLTKAALKRVKRKHKAWQHFRNCKCDANYQAFCKARNSATAECRASKRSFEQKLATEVNSNPKSFWKYVSSKTKTRSGIADLVMDKDTGAKTTSDLEKAIVLNTFFTSVFINEIDDDIPSLETLECVSPLSDIVFSEQEVTKVLSDLKPTKSSGPDGLHPRVLKECCSSLGNPLYNIMKHSIDTGKVPSAWKEGHISAIFKKGSKTEAGNYRPISLTSVVCKALEGIVRKHIIAHMDENNFLSNNQDGFRNRRSTVTQLLDVLDDWTNTLDNNANIDAIYLDFQKAFDTVPHQRLLHKLTSYGIQGKALRWIEAFLTDRKQRVCVNGSFSGWTNVTSGIPQGSVLGPILFVLFINDMPTIVDSYCKLFADDTKLYRTITCPQDCTTLQNDLYKLSEWSETWLLRFNASKCKRMHLCSNNSQYAYQMTEDSDSPLEETREEKDLGVIVDQHLNFRAQISSIVNKGNKIVGIIKRNFEYLDAAVVTKLYSALVRPHLEYANSVWAPYLRKDINIIENVQRRATRLIPSIRSLSYIERLQHLKLFSLAYRRRRGDMIRVYNILNGTEEIGKDLWTYVAGGVTRGHSKKLVKVSCRKNIRLHSFASRIVNDWNGLPESVVSAPTLSSFKRQLDIFWEDSHYSY
jgi:hypothetical protein